MQLTSGQRDILGALSDGPLQTKDIVSKLYTGLNNWSYDQVHSSLRRMEYRELVRRLGEIPARWELTSFGRRSI